MPVRVSVNLPITVVCIVCTFVRFSTIVVTTVWTFVFTHGFMRKHA